MKRYPEGRARLMTIIAAASMIFAPLSFAPGAAAQPTMKIGLATINDAQHEHAKRFAAEMESWHRES